MTMKIPINQLKTCPINSEIYRDSDVGDLVNSIGGELKYSKFSFGVEVDFTRIGDFTWSVSDCEELVGEVNHTTECVTDLFIFWDILFTTQSYESCCFLFPPHIDSFHQL